MALIECRFYSEVLELSCTMNVILPQPTLQASTRQAPCYPTLYLLHGRSDDHAAWCRQTSIERYVQKRNLAVVMPAVDHSFYTDMQSGPRYWQFISEELPRLARGFFPLSVERADNFVAGLSMGGYGAFKLALRQPERFAAAVSLSGALDMRQRTLDDAQRHTGEMRYIFGSVDSMAANGNDLFELANDLVAQGLECPALLQRCGSEDFLLPDNERFAQHARQLGLPLDYATGPGDHDWDYWDTQIQYVLNWLPLRASS